MTSSIITGSAAAILMLTAVCAVGQTREHAPVSLRSAATMSQDKPTSESWTYVSPQFRGSRFSSLCVPPTRIYAGADAQFPGTTEADKRRFADIITRTVTEELRKSFTVYSVKTPGCLKLQMTIVGVENTIGGVATATRVTPFGFALSTVNSLRGKRGTLTGSVLIALEATTGRSDNLLVAAVRRRSPVPLDVEATLSMKDTVSSVGRDYGRELRDRLIASGVMGP